MREVEIGKVYRHFKGKCCYVIDIGVHSETKEKYVIYKKLGGDYSTWVRPLDMFLEEIDENREDNITKQKYRFERIDI